MNILTKSYPTPTLAEKRALNLWHYKAYRKAGMPAAKAFAYAFRSKHS